MFTRSVNSFITLFCLLIVFSEIIKVDIENRSTSKKNGTLCVKFTYLMKLEGIVVLRVRKDLLVSKI